MNKTELEGRQRHGAKSIYRVDKRQCGDECEVEKMLEREASEKHRKSAKCTFFNWGSAREGQHCSVRISESTKPGAGRNRKKAEGKDYKTLRWS